MGNVQCCDNSAVPPDSRFERPIAKKNDGMNLLTDSGYEGDSREMDRHETGA